MVKIMPGESGGRTRTGGPARLGTRYRDILTGFTGTATARTEYLYGCVRVLLEGPGQDGKPEEFYFDEQRLVDADERRVETTAMTGGARPAPPRTGLRP